MNREKAQQELTKTEDTGAKGNPSKNPSKSTAATAGQGDVNASPSGLVSIPSLGSNNGKSGLAPLSAAKKAGQEQGLGAKGSKGSTVTEPQSATVTKSQAKNKSLLAEEEKQPSSAIQIKASPSLEGSKFDTLNKNAQKSESAEAQMQPITDKYFYKEMAKIKEKGARGQTAVPPKKSASAYIIFQKEKRPEILARNPQAKVTEVVKEIARCWGLMTKEDRSKYKEQAKRDKERYDKELKQLEGQSESIKKPKKCLSAYMIFVKETRPKIVEANPDMGALEVMQEVGRAWQSMDDDERAYFKSKADNDKHRYLEEQRKFYDEVARVGSKQERSGDDEDAEDDPQEMMNMINVPKQQPQDVANKVNLQMGQKQMPYAQMAQQNSAAMQQTGGNFNPVAQQKRGPQTDTMQLLQQMQMQNMGGVQQKNMFSGQMNQIALAQNLMNGMQVMGGIPQQTMQAINNPQDQNQLAGGSATKRQKTDDNQGSVKPSTEETPENAANGEQNKEEENEKPKKPCSAFEFFSEEFMPILKQQFASLPNQKLVDAVSKQWKVLSKKLKSPFESMANEDKLRFTKENDQFKADGKFQPHNQLAINRQNLSVHNQQLLKEAITPSKSLLVEMNAMVKAGNFTDPSQPAQAQQNDIFKTTVNQNQEQQQLQQNLQNMGQPVQVQQMPNIQNNQFNAVNQPQQNANQQAQASGLIKTGSSQSNQMQALNNEGDMSGIQDQNQGLFANPALQQQISNQQLLQLLSTQLLQNAIMQQPQNPFQPMNLAAHLGVQQQKNLGQLGSNNNLNDLLNNQLALMNPNIGKISESPQYVGQASAMNDGNIDMTSQLQNMPSVANQPINNIFNPIGNGLLFDEGNYGFGNQNVNQTPLQNPTQMQQPLMQGDFQLPASSFFGDSSTNQQTAMSNQTNQLFMGTQQNNLLGQGTGQIQSDQDQNKLACFNSLQSPLIGPSSNPVMQRANNLGENSNAGDAFNWNNMTNNTSVDLGHESMNASNPLLMKSNKGHPSDGNFFGKQSNSSGMGGMKTMQQQQQHMGMQQNMMPGVMNALKPMQDQGTISASASATNLLQPELGIGANNPGQLDSTHVTPFLRPANPSTNFTGLMNPVHLNPQLNQQFNTSSYGQSAQPGQMNAQGFLPGMIQYNQLQQTPFNQPHNQ